MEICRAINKKCQPVTAHKHRTNALNFIQKKTSNILPFRGGTWNAGGPVARLL